MLKVENLSVSYRGTPILENVGFSLKPHTMTAVLGKNGSGKSTLVSCLNQQVRYTGKIFYADYNIALMNPRERAKPLAILPQVLEIPQVTVEELVMFGRNPYLDFGKRPSEEDRAAVGHDDGRNGCFFVQRENGKHAVRRGKTEGISCDGSGTADKTFGIGRADNLYGYRE